MCKTLLSFIPLWHTEKTQEEDTSAAHPNGRKQGMICYDSKPPYNTID
jgi:hypothetical protein